MAESRIDIDELGLDELKVLLVRALGEIAELRQEVQLLRDENARLKGLKGKPDINPPGKPSGMEKQATSRSGKKGSQKKPRRRGPKNNKLVINETMLLKPGSVPDGSRFKGYDDYVVQDLVVQPYTVCYRRERWKTPDGKTIVADLPGGICGHFGSGLIRFLLTHYHQCQVTIPRLVMQLHG